MSRITLWYYLSSNKLADPQQKPTFTVTVSRLCFQGGKMKRLVLFAGLLSTLLMACNITGAKPVATSTIMPTLSPTSIPTLIPTSTPADVTLRVKDKLINCRLGPGIEYESVNELSQGQSARVAGRNEASTWLYIRDPGNPGGFCWVSADVTETLGAVNELPVAQPTPITVTNVSLRAEPDRIVVNCSQFPQTVFFEAQITTNGPALMTWRWEASTGAISDVGTLVFEEAGTQVINEFYPVNAPNEYWVKLHILTPNDMIQQVNFPVSCTP
jgi:hypothetical protein